MSYRSDVKKDGTVLLSKKICCDGFDLKRKVRIQTHVHDDHMYGFESSKGYQKAIFLSKPTKDLLICDYNADIPYRYNIIDYDYFMPIMVEDEVVEIAPSNHMLGAVQTRVTHSDGYKITYSSDFQMPLDHGVLECDELVIDSTSYSPDQNTHDKDLVIKLLIEKIKKEIEENNIIIQGYRGRLQYVMEIISNEFSHIPLIASDRPYRYGEIYGKYGYVFNKIFKTDSKEAKELYDDGPYILFVEPSESYKLIEEKSYKILLSRYGFDKEPFLEYNEKSARCSLCDHSGFNETLQYIEKTNCERVITDSSRGGDGRELAYNIKTHLGIDAKPATLQFSKEWGV